LSPDRDFIVGESVTLADISFAAEIALFFNEKARPAELLKKKLEPILHTNVEAEFLLAFAHFERLSKHPAFAPDMGSYLKKFESHRSAEANR